MNRGRGEAKVGWKPAEMAAERGALGLVCVKWKNPPAAGLPGWALRPNKLSTFRILAESTCKPSGNASSAILGLFQIGEI